MIGKSVTVHIDPLEKGKYTVEIDPLLEEVKREREAQESATQDVVEETAKETASQDAVEEVSKETESHDIVEEEKTGGTNGGTA